MRAGLLFRLFLSSALLLQTGSATAQTVDQYPAKPVRLILPFPPLILLVLCLISRKTVEISYSVCPACVRARRRRRQTAAGLWVLTAASMLLSVQFDNAWILVPSAVLFAAALTMSFLGNQPLRAVRYTAGTFTVTGFSEGFPGRGVAPEE